MTQSCIGCLAGILSLAAVQLESVQSWDGCAQEALQKAERKVAQARAALEAEQAKAASRASALAEAAARQQADARVLEAARAAWAEGEAERRGAASLLEEARAEAAKAKVGDACWGVHEASRKPMVHFPDELHVDLLMQAAWNKVFNHNGVGALS